MGYLEGYGLISKHKGFLLIFLVLIISLIPSWLVRTLPISFKSADICWNLTFASDFGQSDQYSVVFGKNVYLTPVGHTVRYSFPLGHSLILFKSMSLLMAYLLLLSVRGKMC